MIFAGVCAFLEITIVTPEFPHGSQPGIFIQYCALGWDGGEDAATD
jgi:hypothetical protein